MVAKFNSADQDGDGRPNREEARAGGLKPVAKHFDRLDADRDGKVTREEIRSMLRSRVSHMPLPGIEPAGRQWGVGRHEAALSPERNRRLCGGRSCG